MLIAAIPQQCGGRRSPGERARPDQSQKDMVSSKSFMRRTAADAGENPPAADRRIISDKSHNRFDPALPLEFLNRLEVKTFARTVRRQLETGEPLRVTTMVSPRSTSRASSVRRFFASRIVTVFIQ
jgi:hypothetical protein